MPEFFKKLMPKRKEDKFFKCYEKMVDYANQAAVALQDLTDNYKDKTAKLKKISEIERSCDEVVHEIIHLTNISFITPLDREDLFLLTREIDDIVDFTEEAAHRFDSFNVKTMTQGAKDFARLIAEATLHLKKLMEETSRLKRTKALLEAIEQINRLEHEGDEIYRKEIKNLFVNEKDPINLIRWKDIYSYLEKTLDACKFVANVIEGIVLKHG